MIMLPCTYFDEPGPANTERVIEAVSERLKSAGSPCEAIVVASTSGLTALKFARAIKGIKIICVSEPPSYAEVSGKWPTLQERYIEGLKSFHVEIVNTAPYVFHSYVGGEDSPVPTPEKALREFMITVLGNGFKVAVESVLMATSVGAVAPYKTVIGVGGLSRGADTAIVARSTFPNRVLSPDLEKSFSVKEIIAMPLTKSADPRRRLP
ncbi:MAG: hypothetical protein ABSF36_05295 [Candidatus Methanomethylicaceae archaeon]|jgi:hypothetical protein